MTSSIRSLRSVLALCSPSTHRMESTTLLFPVPLGPTTDVMPWGKWILASANDLNPVNSKDLRCITFLLSGTAVPAEREAKGRGPCTTGLCEKQRKATAGGRRIAQGHKMLKRGGAAPEQGSQRALSPYTLVRWEDLTVTSSLGRRNSTSSSMTVSSSTSSAP